jgi:hypothetical protein
MKPYLLLVMLGATAFSLPPQGKVAPDGHSGQYSQQDIERLLMVAFTDNMINTVKADASSISYRPRGDAYQGSSWSKRISNQLAEDYGLAMIAEWPMTEVGVHCVVYRIPHNITLSAAIDRLSKDRRVEIVQDMHVYNTKGQCCH